MLESFNLVTVNNHKAPKKTTIRTLNPTFRQTPKYNNISNLDSSFIDRLPASSKATPNELLFSRISKHRRGNNFKNMRRIRMNQRRTATNSPAYNDITLAPCFNDSKPKSNGMFMKPQTNMNMTMYGQVLNLPPKYSQTPSTSMQSHR